MNTRATILTLVLTLTGAAAAQTTVTLPGTMPSSITRALPDLQKFLASGGTVTVHDRAGTAIGTVNANGTITLAAGKTLADVTAVRVTPVQGTPQVLTLSRSLEKPGAIKFDVTQPNGKTQSLPLPALVNRMMDDRQDADDRGGKQSKSGKADKGKGNSKK